MNLRLETEINTSADRVWEIIGGQFAEVGDWYIDVAYSRAIPAEEVPEGVSIAPEAPVPGRYTESKFVKAYEFLTAYSNQERAFTFIATGLPKFMVSSMQNKTKVISVSANQSIISFDITIKFTLPFLFLGPILKRRMSKTFKRLHLELKRYAETGEISAEKQAQLQAVAGA